MDKNVHPTDRKYVTILGVVSFVFCTLFKRMLEFCRCPLSVGFLNTVFNSQHILKRGFTRQQILILYVTSGLHTAEIKCENILNQKFFDSKRPLTYRTKTSPKSLLFDLTMLKFRGIPMHVMTLIGWKRVNLPISRRKPCLIK